MPLVGLDEIDWAKLSANGSAEDIPDLLRALDNAETEEDFENFYGKLGGRIQRYKDVYNSTAPTIIFLIQILQTLSKPNQQFRVLRHLGNILRDIEEFPLNIFKNRADCLVVLFRENIATYDAIATGLENYLVGINNENKLIRLANLYVLFELKAQREEILPRLIQSFDAINDEWFRACLVWTYANIAKYDKYGHEQATYETQLNRWLEHSSSLVRYAAAFGKLRIYMPSLETNELTIQTIVEALQADIWRYKQHEIEDIGLYLELSPFRDLIPWISRTSIHIVSDLWLAVLRQLNHSPVLAHVCVGETLKHTFSMKNVDRYWPSHLYLDYPPKDQIVYQESSVFSYRLGNKLSDKQRLVLQTIADCEPFWEIPTNLFSFFYGLPDDREQLRKLAEGNP
jgi:hypothetical protein